MVAVVPVQNNTQRAEQNTKNPLVCSLRGSSVGSEAIRRKKNAQLDPIRFRSDRSIIIDHSSSVLLKEPPQGTAPCQHKSIETHHYVWERTAKKAAKVFVSFGDVFKCLPKRTFGALVLCGAKVSVRGRWNRTRVLIRLRKRNRVRAVRTNRPGRSQSDFED